MDALYSEFRAVDNLVARNTARVLKAFQNARVGSHVSSRNSSDFLFYTVKVINTIVNSFLLLTSNVVDDASRCVSWLLFC